MAEPSIAERGDHRVRVSSHTRRLSDRKLYLPRRSSETLSLPAVIFVPLVSEIVFSASLPTVGDGEDAAGDTFVELGAQQQVSSSSSFFFRVDIMHLVSRALERREECDLKVHIFFLSYHMSVS